MMLVRLRVTGSILVILSYFVILHISPSIGALGTLIGDVLSMPFFIYTKAWDIVIMLCVLIAISASGMLPL